MCFSRIHKFLTFYLNICTADDLCCHNSYFERTSGWGRKREIEVKHEKRARCRTIVTHWVVQVFRIHSDAINSGIFNITTLVFCHISYMIQFTMSGKNSGFFETAQKKSNLHFFMFERPIKRRGKNQNNFSLYLDMRKKCSSGQMGFFMFFIPNECLRWIYLSKKNSGLIEINNFFWLPHVYG